MSTITTKKRLVAKVFTSPRPGKSWAMKVRGEVTYFRTKAERDSAADELNK